MPVKQKKDDNETQALRQAYGAATQQLRENHRDEFEDLYTKAAANLGITRSPRLTAEQRAEQTIEGLFTEHPHLRDRFAGAQEGSA
jgi:hypothetical protein